MDKIKYFEKIDKDLINNRALNSHEKLIYIICKSFENAPRGCRISHKYLMLRTGIKTQPTLIRCLDRLTLFGMLAFAWYIWERGYEGKPFIEWI